MIKKLNEMLKVFFKLLMQDQINIYQDSVSLIERIEANKSKVIEKILSEIKKKKIIM